ncbi:ADAT3 [Enterospora canceri]|uniref:ADAT3 n=1 Tax=Enterospora canceri TaxID=1081671 RepID=A0A1Y1S512_9MICR|nr:ADAT3 [Enterospora canceri]
MELELNKSSYEERKMGSRRMKAVRVSKDEVSGYLWKGGVRQADLRWLKQIKRVNSNEFLVLVGDEFGSNETQIETVAVPTFQPLTDEQVADANSLWPTLYKKKEEAKESFISRDTVEIEVERMRQNHPKQTKCVEYAVFIDHNTLISRFSLKPGPVSLLDRIFSSHILLNSITKVSQHQNGTHLCTGTDLILSNEPCYSCAMALIHCRIGNVVILRKRENGVFSRWKLNQNESTNHRFKVWFLR